MKRKPLRRKPSTEPRRIAKLLTVCVGPRPPKKPIRKYNLYAVKSVLLALLRGAFYLWKSDMGAYPEDRSSNLNACKLSARAFGMTQYNIRR